MKITRSQLKQIIKEELEAALHEEKVTPGGDWIMPAGHDENDSYEDDIGRIYAFLDGAYAETKSEEDYPTSMGHKLEWAPTSVRSEELGPNWIRWMVANYFNDKFGGARTPEQVSKTYSDMFYGTVAAVAEEEPLVLPKLTQDPMGRGPETSDLRRRSMRRK